MECTLRGELSFLWVPHYHQVSAFDEAARESSCMVKDMGSSSSTQFVTTSPPVHFRWLATERSWVTCKKEMHNHNFLVYFFLSVTPIADSFLLIVYSGSWKDGSKYGRSVRSFSLAECTALPIPIFSLSLSDFVCWFLMCLHVCQHYNIPETESEGPSRTE